MSLFNSVIQETQKELRRLVKKDGGATHAGDAMADAELAINHLVNDRDTLLEALQGLEAAYCRAGTSLTRDERTEDRMRLIAARAAIAKALGEKA